ncbi:MULTISPECIES: PDDEXK family nuclease [Nitrospirillum]|uniref:DUF91 domain-containing protein n=1 Tax=Nitrospirillum amazonense TaxID=28077 RepID=A0A560EXK6_9PROT|nr:hypothetical protein [Nitrospirillum amazonense]MEC4594645.1 hypothetical protein [Nitrospirillum amazonense]TWB14084.1 hypothetical protein FBZ88_13310 [Nitrospirillum amazonense]
MTRQFGQPFLLTALDQDSPASPLYPVKREAATGSPGLYNELWLQNLIARHPEILPLADVEPLFADARSICTELPVAGGYADNLLVTPDGDISLVECKLWKNPQARREVIGQILDYAATLARWDYEQLDKAVRLALPGPSYVKNIPLYDRLKSESELSEAAFIDAVSRNLRQGRFLLLIAGDGIREGLETMADYLQRHVGLHFTLALVELAIFSHPAGGYFVQPRTLARTVEIKRDVITLAPAAYPPPLVVGGPPVETVGQRGMTLTEEEMYRQLDALEPGLSARLRTFLTSLEPLGISQEFSDKTIKIVGLINDEVWPLGAIYPSFYGKLSFETLISKARKKGDDRHAQTFYRRLVELIADPESRAAALKQGTKTGTRMLPLQDLLAASPKWTDALVDFLRTQAQEEQT